MTETNKLSFALLNFPIVLFLEPFEVDFLSLVSFIALLRPCFNVIGRFVENYL